MVTKNDKTRLKSIKPYIVAELNSSHRGKIEVAKEMINAAKSCKCDAVKFQSWTPESLYCQNYYDQNPISKRMVSSFSLTSRDLLELAEYCGELEIDFTSTPYSKSEVDFLVEKCNVPFIKIASMDINNLLFLRYIAQKNVPIVLSTGMATIEEIEIAVKEIEKMGNNDICILHCVSLYPATVESVNLNNILMLKDRFPQCKVGYSDHTMGYEVACAAVAMGASLIEKHFTLDNKRIGWDNQMATEPSEMKALVDSCQNVYLSMGKYERKIEDAEYEQRQKMRRSLVAAKDIVAGHIISLEDIDAKRPGDGFPADHYNEVIGKSLKVDVCKDEMILENNIQ